MESLLNYYYNLELISWSINVVIISPDAEEDNIPNAFLPRLLLLVGHLFGPQPLLGLQSSIKVIMLGQETQ